MYIADKGFVAASYLPEKNIIDAYMDICRERDHITYRHSLNVEVVAEKISSAMSLDEETIKIVRLGAKYHDIGKTVLPENIVKTGIMYSDLERAEMQRHPEKGVEVLDKFGPFVQLPMEAREIVLMHHEKLDGSGYPHRLSAKMIPLQVRIVAVADVLAALCEDRYYRDGWQLQKAFLFLNNKKSVFYDADVVESAFFLDTFLYNFFKEQNDGK